MLYFPFVYSSALIGIDLGSEFIKIASILPGKSFDIVLNKNSQRKTINAIAFDSEQRIYSEDALNMKFRYPENSIIRLNDLLGVHLDSEQIKYLVQNLGLKNNFMLDNGKRFKIHITQNMKEELILKPEELVGMFLSFIKTISMDYLKKNISQCVITVPSFFTLAQRQALLDAANIAGLNVLQLVDENVAAAVQYGIYNSFSSQSKNIMIYNMGSASTKVTIFSFSSKTKFNNTKFNNTEIKVLAKAHDAHLGGNELDRNLLNFLSEKFIKQHGKSPLNNAHAFERLRASGYKD